MASYCKTVNLYTRKIKNGEMLSYYLDYYPGWRDPATNRVIRRESIGINIYANPKNQREKEYNSRMSEKAEAVRCMRYEEVVNERYGFFDRKKLQESFIDYFKAYAGRKNLRYENAFRHFSAYTGGKCTFAELNIEFCNKFLEYLRNTSQLTHTGHRLHANTIHSYWSAFVGTIHMAFREHRITENIAPCLNRATAVPTEKYGLSADELATLADTPCDEPELRRAFLFACLTGLRKSDIRQLTWEMIQPEADGRLYMTIRMRKTKDIIHNPIGEEALELIGERGCGLVFPHFMEKMTQAPLRKWLRDAGITKNITFHSSRHTFCTLQLEAGTDSRTVQKLVGHKRLETTQCYIDNVDRRKVESADRITLRRKSVLYD